MNYIELKISIPENKEYIKEVVTAFLAEYGYESFTEKENNLFAYITLEDFDKNKSSELMESYSLEYSFREIQQQNWNKEWETHYQPIVIENILSIKAPFHNQDFNTKHTIIIEPKMSFGTGHHATTYMMCQLMEKYDFAGKNVLDMGCGTGVLAIYSSILGAKNIVAIDIDQWAYENTVENVNRNNIHNIIAIKGNVDNIPQEKYDIILANINLNILKNDIPQYQKHLNKNGIILFSGFFYTELDQIVQTCSDNNLKFIENITKEDWTACLFRKENL